MPPEPTATDVRLPAVPASVRLHALTAAMCLVAVAAAAIGICGADGFAGVDWLWLAGSVALTAAAAVVGHRLARSRGPRLDGWSDRVGPALMAIYTGNVVVEPLIRALGGGRPLEILLYAGMASLVPVLAFGAAVRRWVPVAGLVTLAVTLFGVCLLSDPAVAMAAAVWTALVPVWLVVLTDESTEGERIDGRGRSGRRVAIAAAVGGLVLIGLAAASLGGRESLSLSRGFLASSGGDGQESEFARDGVGDGRHLVPATTMAESFGPIDDAPFAKSDEPSLYDVFEERYDEAEAVKITKNDRAVALAADQVQQEEREMAEAEAAGRAFSTLRSPRDGRRGEVGDRRSDALFYVAGRVPIHLRTAVFDEFDGAVWRTGAFAERERPTLTMRTVDERPWVVLRDEAEPGYRDLAPVLSDAEAHAIKPVHIDGPLIPLPPTATAIHIRDVPDETMFRPLPGGLVAMDRKRLPKMVPIHVASRRVDRDRLADDARFYGGPHELHELPAGPRTNAIADLASRWTDGLDRGWPQIAAIERRLRKHAALDEAAVADADATMPVADFVLGEPGLRRGPDYLFATAAAVMLRSQGYAARLVQGFYVRPEKFDAAGRHTPVHAGDLHTWCEVRMPGGVWVTIEPTPGYRTLGPPRSVWYRLAKAIAGVPGIIWQARWAVALTALMLLALFLTRHRLRDAAWMLWLRLSGRDRDPLAVWRLLDWRLRRTRPAPVGWTPRRRVAALGLTEADNAKLSRLIDAVERSAFASAAADGDAKDATAADVCNGRDLLAALSLGRLRSRAAQSATAEDPEPLSAAVRRGDRAAAKSDQTKETAL